MNQIQIAVDRLIRWGLTLILASVISVTALAGADPAPTAGDNKWLDLFNGKNLDGWTVKITGQPFDTDPDQTFRVESGLLVVRYNNYEAFAGQFGHLFYASPFSHYALHVEYRFVGEQTRGGPAGWAMRNSGVMVHAQAPDSMTLRQDFPVSIEAQFLGGLDNGQARPTGNVCTPGTDITVAGKIYPHHCLASSSATYDGDQWVNMTVVVLGGGSITHYVEGNPVLRYEKPQLDAAAAHASDNPGATSLTGGYIALQSESHPIDFKQVRLLNLAGCMDPAAKNHEAYYVKADNESCNY